MVCFGGGGEGGCVFVVVFGFPEIDRGVFFFFFFFFFSVKRSRRGCVSEGPGAAGEDGAGWGWEGVGIGGGEVCYGAGEPVGLGFRGDAEEVLE